MQKCKCARFNFRFSWAKQSVPLVFSWSVKSETQTELFPASPNVPVEPKARRFIVFLLVSFGKRRVWSDASAGNTSESSSRRRRGTAPERAKRRGQRSQCFRGFTTTSTYCSCSVLVVVSDLNKLKTDKKKQIKIQGKTR